MKNIIQYLIYTLIFITCYVIIYILIISFSHLKLSIKLPSLIHFYEWYKKPGMSEGDVSFSIVCLICFFLLLLLGFLVLSFANGSQLIKRSFINYYIVILFFFSPTFTALEYRADYKELDYPYNLPSSRYVVIKPFGVSLIYFITKKKPFNFNGIWFILNKPNEIIGFEIILFPKSLSLWLEFISIIISLVIVLRIKKYLISKFLLQND